MASVRRADGPCDRARHWGPQDPVPPRPAGRAQGPAGRGPGPASSKGESGSPLNHYFFFSLLFTPPLHSSPSLPLLNLLFFQLLHSSPLLNLLFIQLLHSSPSPSIFPYCMFQPFKAPLWSFGATYLESKQKPRRHHQQLSRH